MAAGRPDHAIDRLIDVPNSYREYLIHMGINMMDMATLNPMLAALKVLATAMVQTLIEDYVDLAVEIRADVEETEAR